MSIQMSSRYYFIAASKRYDESSQLCLFHLDGKPQKDGIRAEGMVPAFSYRTIIPKTQLFSSPEEALTDYRNELEARILSLESKLRQARKVLDSLPESFGESRNALEE